MAVPEGAQATPELALAGADAGDEESQPAPIRLGLFSDREVLVHRERMRLVAAQWRGLIQLPT